MKILHVINGLKIGGAEKTLYNLVSFDKKNIHTIINLNESGIFETLLIQKNYEVININIKNNLFNFFKLFKYIKYIKSKNFDAIQGWMYHGNLFAFIIALFINNKNIIWNIRGPFEKNLTKFSTKIIVFLCAYISIFFRIKIIYNSKYSQINHIKNGYNKSNTYLIYNGYKKNTLLNLDLYNKYLKKYKLKDYFIIGSVARFDSHKDHITFFSSLNILKSKFNKFKCIMIGENINYNNKYLKKLITKYHLEEYVILFEQNRNLNFFYSLLDIHLLSSISESFPNVIAESMLCGVPSVATNVGDIEFIIDKFGWIVPNKNPVKLSSAILEAVNLKNDNKKWQLLKKNCIEQIDKNFNIANTIKLYNLCWTSKKVITKN